MALHRDIADRSTPRASYFIVVGIGILLSAATARAADPSAGKATNSRAARDEAVKSIPFDKLSGEMRTRVSTVINNVSVYRRLPTQSIDCDPDLFVFLVRNPEVIVDIWRVMGITNMTLDRSGPDRYRASRRPGDDRECRIRLSQRRLTRYLFRGNVRRADVPDQAPRTMRDDLEKQLRSRVERTGLGRQSPRRLPADRESRAPRSLPRHCSRLLGKTADHNFSETTSFVGTLAHTAETNPSGVSRLAQRLRHVEPQIRQQFADLAVRAADDATADAALAQSANGKSPQESSAAAQIRPASGDVRER